MAKHYSGKRVAGRKPVGKRALSLLMALVMSLSLVQITAFAVEEITNYRVVEQGTEVSDNAGLVTIKKKATHKTDDQFDINLSVTVKKTEETTVTNNPAHIVLVMDRSNSMEENSGRFANARKAAKTFVSALLKGNDTENDNGNRIAVVGFGTKADTGTAFSNDVEKLNGWIESATKAYKNNNDGGTNIQAGIHEAQRLLKNDGFTGKKIIVVFSDGMPTYSYRYVNTAEVTKCHMDWGTHVVDEYKLTGTWHFDYNDRVGSGSAYGYRDDFWNNDYPYVRCTCKNHRWEKTDYITVKDILKTNGDATIAEAKIAKENGTEIYSVYLGGSDEQQNKNALETMKGIVSDAEKNFLSTNKMEDLAKLFGQIAQTITTETSGLTVSDPMGDFITLGNVQALVDAGVITLAKDGRSFTWILANTPAANVTEDKTAGTTTYTLTYPVTLNAADPDFVSDTAYPTNGTTTLTYYVTDDTTAHTLDFVVPTVTATKATTPEPEKVSYTVNYFLQQGGTYAKEPTYTATIELAEEGEITIGNLYTAYPTAPAGYELDEAMLDEDFGNVRPGTYDFTDGQVFNLYYKVAEVEPEKVSYTVNYFLEQGDTYAKDPTYTATIELAEEGEITITALKVAYPDAPDGYVLDEEMVAEEFGNVRPGTYAFTDGQVFNLYYKLAEVEPEGPFTYWVQHIYMNGETIDGKTYDEVKEVPYETEVDPMAIEPVLKYTTEDGVEHVYKVESRDPMEKTLITENDQVFTIYYQRNDPAPVEYTYSVKHIYLAPDGVTVEGKAELWDQGPVTAGMVVKADSIERVYKNTFNGTEYTYEFKSDSGDITVNDNNQVIELIYQRTASAPETNFTYTVKYFYRDSDTADYVEATDEFRTGEAKDGVQLTVLAGQKSGYTFTKGDQPGVYTLTADKHDFELYYTKISSTPINPPVGPSYDYYTVTVNYYDKDSKEVIHTAYTTSQREGTVYDVTAQDKIAIEGYTYVETTGAALTGTLNGNKVINVYYSKTTDIDDGDTPTTPAEPGSDIGDDDVPTTPAQPPKTGDSMGLWIAAALVSGMGLVWLALSGKKREERA